MPDPETGNEGLPLEGHVLGSEPAALPAVGSHVRLAARSFNTEDDDAINLNSTLDKAVPQPTDSPSGVALTKDTESELVPATQPTPSGSKKA